MRIADLNDDTLIVRPFDVFVWLANQVSCGNRGRQRARDGAKFVVEKFVCFSQRASENPLPCDHRRYAKNQNEPH